VAISSLVGASVKRREDPRMITGTGQYVDDVKLVNMAYMAVLRSPHGHARIRSINADAARQAPGVLTVLTGEDVKDRLGVVPVAAQLPDMKVPKHYSLAVGKVRYVGEPVAVVAAESRYAAQDAVALIDVDYEPLPAVIDIEKAVEPGAPVIHEEVGSQEEAREDATEGAAEDPAAVRYTPGRPDAEEITEAAAAQPEANRSGDANVAYRWTLAGGDVEKAFSEAEVTVKQRMVNQRLAPVPMETRTVAASFQRGADEMTIWSSTQIPHLLKTQLALMLGLPEHKVRVISPDVGGGFGCKLNVYAEEALTALLAKDLGRPVNWVEQRTEGMQGTIHGRDHVAYVEAAAKRDGTITGLRYKVYADLGAFHQLLTPAIPTLTGLMVPGPYKIPNVTIDVIAVFTNKMATDAYRGAGRPEATYYLERIVDIVAKELGMDPVEVRRKNLIGPDQFPYTTATGLAYDSGNYQPALDKALAVVGYDQLRREQSQLAQGGTKRLGIGLSTYVEVCGMGPSAAMPAGGWESSTVRVEPTGMVTVLTGAHPHGQGEETTFAQIVADRLGVGIDDVRVIHGDTSVVQYGIGIFGSRGLAVGGSAVVQATDRVKEKALKIAAHLLEASVDDLVYENGQVVVKGAPDRRMSFQDITTVAYLAAKLPPEIEPGLEAVAFFEPPNFTFPFGTHVAVVEVDTESGKVKLRRYVGVDDCGRVINPMIVDGQLHGGLAQGIAQALFEEVVYDENGQLVTGSLNDYAIPKAGDFPMFEMSRTETPSPVNPLGVKGVGEAATIGSTPAIVNAVCNALGVSHLDMPLRAERVWRAAKNGS
jgi:aerobic carbon-monoxide dehydrogenase large subunit